MDAFIILIACYLAYWLRFESYLTRKYQFLQAYSGYWDFKNDIRRQMIFVIPAYLLLYYSFNLYGPKRVRSKRLELWNIIKANLVGIAYFGLVLIFRKEDMEYMRAFLGLFFFVNVILSFLFRIIVKIFLSFYRKRGYNLKHVLVVGYSRTAERYINRVLLNPEWGYYIHGILDDTMKPGSHYKNIKILNNIDRLEYYLAHNTLDEIAITLSINEYEKLEKIVAICEKSGVHTKFIPDYNNIIPTKPYTEDLNGLPVINIRSVPLKNPINRFVKRAVDIFGALVAITIFAIPMLIIAIIIKTTSKGPLIFKQTRIGLHNKEFEMYKFRSMEVQSAEKEKKAWTTMNDPRVTPIGKFIRRTSIDELPQLFNVLKGDMSLVGPRPERPFFVKKFKEEIPRYMIKHQVRPGITGWAQISGYRGDTSIIKRIEHDLYYIENWTLSFDFKILFLTFFKGFINKNAY